MEKNYLREAADAAKAKLPDNYGMILLAFPFNGEGDGRIVYISNAKREDVIKTMKEFIIRCGAGEDWMKFIP